MKGRILPPLGLLALVSLTFAPGFSSTRVYFFRDLSAFFYPLPELAWRMIRAGQLPLWNPYSGFGLPLAAMPDLLLFYPGTWLRFLLPYPFGFNFHIIAHFYLAAWSTYALGRRMEMSRPAAFGAALAFTLGGPLLSLGSMLNVLVAACWMPMVLLVARWAGERPSAPRILAVGAALGMQAIGGEPLFNLATAVLALLLGGSSLIRFLRIMVPAALFGMALIAVQLIPGLEMLRDSVRQTSYFTFAESSFWSLHPLNLLDCLVPGVMAEQGSSSYRQFLYGAATPYLISLYLGLVPLGLAVWALMVSGRREAARVAAVAGFSLAFALGHHAAFFSWFHATIPFVATSRYPSKAMVLAGFCVALLAGWGLDSLEHRRAFQWGWGKWAAALAIGFGLQLWMADPTVVAWAVRKTADLFQGPLAAIHAVKLAALAAPLALAVALGPIRPRMGVSIALLALAADLIPTGYWLNPTAPSEVHTKRPPLVDDLGSGDPNFRVDGDRDLTGGSLPIREGWSSEALATLESRLRLTHSAPLEGLRDSGDFPPNRLFTPEFHRFRQQVRMWLRHREQRLLGEYNVRYVIQLAGPAAPPGLHQVTVVPTLSRRIAVWELDSWRPRAEMEGGVARIVAETPARLALHVESANGGTLLLRDRYHRGWKAWVDGAAVEVRPVGLFRAITVPHGGHTVEFAFRPWTFAAGAALSAAALLLWLLVAITRSGKGNAAP